MVVLFLSRQLFWVLTDMSCKIIKADSGVLIITLAVCFVDRQFCFHIDCDVCDFWKPPITLVMLLCYFLLSFCLLLCAFLIFRHMRRCGLCWRQREHASIIKIIIIHNCIYLSVDCDFGCKLCVCVCVCVCVRARVCVSASVSARACVCVHGRALWMDFLFLTWHGLTSANEDRTISI